MKQQRHHCHSDLGVDRLSGLPEPIRSHILFFLPMEDAVRTTILSRQWRGMASSLSSLVFNQDALKNKKDCYRNIVDRFLINHDRSDIQRFDVIANEPLTEVDISSWISFAVRRNVRDLHLRIKVVLPSCLPSCLFTSSTLSILHLDNVRFNLPALVRLPLLKTLILYRVILYEGSLTRNFFSRCPLLENFDVTYLIVTGNPCLSFTIYSTSLKILSINQYYTTHCLNIHAPELQKISYHGFHLPIVSPETRSSMCIASFRTVLQPLTAVRYDVCNFLMGMHNVTKLSLIGNSMEIVAQDPNVLACPPTLCSNLKFLELQVAPAKSHVQGLIMLLRNCPNLQTLCITMKQAPNSEICCIGEELFSRNIDHLNKVEIKNFLGSVSEIELLRFLLANANNLEEINIHCYISTRDKESVRLRICEKLLTFTKVSPHAAILFS